jgi:hypothetical protein
VFCASLNGGNRTETAIEEDAPEKAVVRCGVPKEDSGAGVSKHRGSVRAYLAAGGKQAKASGNEACKCS